MSAARSPIKGLEVCELTGKAAHDSLVTDFGQIDAPTEPAPLLELAPIEEDRVAAVLSPRKVNRMSMEEQRIAADLAYNRRKNSGQLLRSDIDRCIQADRDAGVLR